MKLNHTESLPSWNTTVIDEILTEILDAKEEGPMPDPKKCFGTIWYIPWYISLRTKKHRFTFLKRKLIFLQAGEVSRW